jgi:Zn-dependent protease with chaperone function
MSSPSLPANPLQGRDAARARAIGVVAARRLQAEERGWVPWTAPERESFFAAIARHRRASWRITYACAFAIAVLTVVVAVLLSPLLICLVGLLVDVVNLIVPVPNVLGASLDYVDSMVNGDKFTYTRLAETTAIAVIPGLILMGGVVLALNRALKRSPLFDAGELPGRAPTRAVLAEQRLANVVAEMALAASIPPPNVRIIPGGINAAVFGRDEAHTTIVVGEGLLTSLARGEMQGAIAHLIGSIAGGDMPIGLRAAVTFSLFGLLARSSAILADRQEFYSVGRILRTLMWPTRAGTEQLIHDLADPFRPAQETTPAARPKPPAQQPNRRDKTNQLTWREWAMMPLMGPVILSGFLSGLVSTFLLNPLVSFAWRRRKYMADAAAVRLTRDPDTLAQALHKIIEQGWTRLHAWTMHMAIAQSGPPGAGGLFGGSIVSIFPSTVRRYKALGRLGATLQPITQERPALPLPAAALIGALATIAGGLMVVAVGLLMYLSAAISLLFTVPPLALVHLLLRWIGH